jgi:predicted Rossmann fold nucleotide-binding protein DprA/Smf involved in DNA uptake
MKIAVVGSRVGFSKEYVYDILKTRITTGDVIITGGASGVDTYAEQYAKDNDIQCEIIRPINLI